MPVFAFAAGLTLRRGEQLLEFRRHLQNGQIQFEDPLSGSIYAWPLDKVYRDVNNGDLSVFRGDALQRNDGDGSTSKPLALLPSLDSLPVEVRDEIERRLDYVNTAKKQGLTKGRRQLLTELIRKVAQRRKEKAPSTSTVMRWWRALDEHDGYPGSLVSGYVHRKRSRSLSVARIALIKKMLRETYFTRARQPLAHAHLLINRALANFNEPNAEKDTRAGVSISTLRRIVNDVGPYFRDVARFGPAFARNKWRYSLQGTTTSRVLERIEVDHTQLDLVVICDRSGLPLGRPTITVAIDAHSGYVIAFFVSFWGPGLGPTLNALKIAISPKDPYCQAHEDLKHPWLGYGLFELVVVDNGLEFHSPQFKLAAWSLNADIQYCAVRQPWLKPSVERVLGTLGLMLPAAGRVYKPERNYLPPDPRETAAITFSQLCSGLLKCFVDILPMEPNERTLMEPFEIFRDGFERLPPPLLPTSFTDLELIGAMSKELTVGNEGVVFQYLRYNSKPLQELRRQIAHTFRTPIKFHPEDLDFIYVQDPRTKQWLLVPSCYPEYTRQLSIVQHHAIRAHLKGQLKTRNTMETLVRGKLELIDLYHEFLRGNRGKRNVKAAQKFGALTSAQTLLDTGSISEKVSMPAPALVTTDDFDFHEREIPHFDSFQLD